MLQCASIKKKKPASCRPLLDYCFFADLRAFRFLRIAICFLRSSMLAYANCVTNGPARQTFEIQMKNLTERIFMATAARPAARHRSFSGSEALDLHTVLGRVDGFAERTLWNI